MYILWIIAAVIIIPVIISKFSDTKKSGNKAKKTRKPNLSEKDKKKLNTITHVRWYEKNLKYNEGIKFEKGENPDDYLWKDDKKGDVVVAAKWWDNDHLQFITQDKSWKYCIKETDIIWEPAQIKVWYFEFWFDYCPYCWSNDIFCNKDKYYVIKCYDCGKYGKYLPPDSNGNFRKSCCNGVSVRWWDKKFKYPYWCNSCWKVFPEASFTSEVKEYKRLLPSLHDKNFSENHCWRCAKYIRSYYKRCTKCRWVICPRCWACFCWAPDYVLQKLK